MAIPKNVFLGLIYKFRFVDMLVIYTFFKTVVSMSMVDTEKKTGIKQGLNN